MTFSHMLLIQNKWNKEILWNAGLILIYLIRHYEKKSFKNMLKTPKPIFIRVGLKFSIWKTPEFQFFPGLKAWNLLFWL